MSNLLVGTSAISHKYGQLTSTYRNLHRRYYTVQYDMSSGSPNLNKPNANTNGATSTSVDPTTYNNFRPEMGFHEDNHATRLTTKASNSSGENKVNDQTSCSLGNERHSNVNLNATDVKIDYVYRFSRGTRTDRRYLEKRRRLSGEAEVADYKESDVYGSESISALRKRSSDLKDQRREAANLKFRCGMHAREWTEVGRTMGMRVYVTMVLLLLGVATCAAAPAHRAARHDHLDNKYVKSYLERFGYLRKGRPEIANLLHGDAAQHLEDDFRIAIKTLQEFGGIQVTGELDEATKELLKKKRCGRPDREIDSEDGHRKKRFAVQGEKWKHTNLTWSLSSLRRPSQLETGGTRAVLARALDVWEQASRLTFAEINSDEADIVVSFAKRDHGDLYPFDGRGSILAHAFFPGTGRGGDAHFDDDELWLLHPNNDEEEGTSLFAVAAHEFGHSLGLSHSSVRGALMFPWYQGIQPNFALPDDDRNGIQQMYGPKEKRSWARIPVYQPVEPPPTTTTSTSTTTTTTRRTYYHHHHHNQHPDWPYLPSHTPYRPPHRHYPERPHFPDRRYYNTTEEHPRRTHPYPRPTPETTPRPTYYPKYPTARPEYPSYRPNYPKNDYPKTDYPKKKPYYPEKTTSKPTPPPPSDKPDTCDTTYDAVSLIRGELFIFKNRYHWRIGAQGRYPAYPIEITRMWSGLPKNLTHVDAVYERPDKKIAFFIGKELYLFDSQYLMRGYPKSLVDLGLPGTLEKIDAAMVWGHNGKTYFYSGNMYWKFDEDEGRVELVDYPRDMAMWKGVGYNIDSVFQWKDGKTYFFKGKGYWKFNDLQMRVEHERQMPSAPFWMGCPAERAGRRAPFRALPALPTLRSPSSQHSHLADLHLLSSSLLILYFFQKKI